MMNNLIYRREIPVMIGVVINPGRTPEQPEPNPSQLGDRDTNRPNVVDVRASDRGRTALEAMVQSWM